MKKRAKRTSPEKRKQDILNIALDLLEKIGYANLTLEKVAMKAKIARGLIYKYFPKSTFRTALIKEAIEQKKYKLLAAGILSKDPFFKSIEKKLHKKIMDSIN